MPFLNQIKLRTPESVELDFTLAGIGNRALALIIDYIVLGALLTLVLLAWAFLSLGTTLIDNLGGSSKDAQLWIQAIQILISFTLYVGYFVIFETLWQGQSPGKRYTRIRVIHDDGRMIGIQQAALRALLRPVDDLSSVGALMIMLGKREKRLGDWAAGTVVIQIDQPEKTDTISISPDARQLATQLPQLSDLSQLRPDDFGVIREFLRRRSVMVAYSRRQLATGLASQLSSLIQFSTDQPLSDPEVFLEAVYQAYQQRLTLSSATNFSGTTDPNGIQ